VLLLGIIISIGPWAWRNYRIHKAFIPVSLEGGTYIYMGNNPLATGGTGGDVSWGRDLFLPADIPAYTVEAERALPKMALKYIVTCPRRTAQLTCRKFVNMWRPYLADARPMNKIISGSSYILIVVLAILGMIKTLHKGFRKYILLYCLILYYIIIHLIALGIVRHRYPVMPILIIFAACFITAFLKTPPGQSEN
jgi:hypothetical protein